MHNKCMGLYGYLVNIPSNKLFICPSSHFRHCRKGIGIKMQFEVDPKMLFVHLYIRFRKTALAERTSHNCFLITCALKHDAQVVFCKGFFGRISHSPRTPLGHDRRRLICKHYVDKLKKVFCFVLFLFFFT